jgi:hypothetical protein
VEILVLAIVVCVTWALIDASRVRPLSPPADLGDSDDCDDDPTDPDVDLDDDEADQGPALSPAWWDDRSCWGCERACKASSFKPYGYNVGADVRGAGAARARVAAGQPYHAGFAPSEHHAQVGRDSATSVAALWSDLCERCGEWMRAGCPRDAAVVVAADESVPF